MRYFIIATIVALAAAKAKAEAKDNSIPWKRRVKPKGKRRNQQKSLAAHKKRR